MFVHRSLLRVIGDVQSAAVATGLRNKLGNKGGVGVSFCLGQTSFLFVCCHLARTFQGVVVHANRTPVPLSLLTYAWLQPTNVPWKPATLRFIALIAASTCARAVRLLFLCCCLLLFAVVVVIF